jgi:hypothetical protein
MRKFVFVICFLICSVVTINADTLVTESVYDTNGLNDANIEYYVVQQITRECVKNIDKVCLDTLNERILLLKEYEEKYGSNLKCVVEIQEVIERIRKEMYRFLKIKID